MPSLSEVVSTTASSDDLETNVTSASYASVASSTTTSTSNSAGAPIPSVSGTPSTANKKGGKVTKTDSKKRKLADGDSAESNEKVAEMEKSLKFYKEAYEEMMRSLQEMENKMTDVKADHRRAISKKDEQLSIQDELMNKGKDEILRLRSAIEELETEKEHFRQKLMDKEQAERESIEAEEDRKFRARQQEFGDLLNSNSASGSGQKYRIPRKQEIQSSSRSRDPSPRPSGSRSRDPSPPPAPRPSASFGPSARSTPPAPRQGAGAAFSRTTTTKLPPYCKKFLLGDCTYGNQCKFIHVSEGERQRLVSSQSQSQDRQEGSQNRQTLEELAQKVDLLVAANRNLQ